MFPQRVICDRCGQSNPDGVAFCRDCGNQLQGGPAVAENAASQKPPAADTTMRSEPPRSRPAAPAFEFAPRGPIPTETRCRRCSALSSTEAGFCSACGLAFDQPSMHPPIRGDVDSPIVHLASASQPPAPLACPRCEGGNHAGVRFCQHCGEPLRASAALAGGVSAHQPYNEQNLPGFPYDDRAPESAPIPLIPLNSPPAGGEERRVDASREIVGDGAGFASDGDLARAKRASLVVIAQDGSPGTRHWLTPTQIDVGRAGGEILLPNDPYVSERHARIVRRDGRYFIRDLDSINGIYLRVRMPRTLGHGDLILVGLQVLRFEIVSDAAAGHGVAVENGVSVFGSPSLPRYARLRQLTVEGTTRNIYYLSTNQTVLGRESGDIVFTSDPFMSRNHVAFVRNPENGVFALRDLGSSNGSYVALRDETALNDGDFLRIGQHLFRFDHESSELN